MRFRCVNLRVGIAVFYVLTSIAFVLTSAMLIKEYLNYSKDINRPKRSDSQREEIVKIQPQPRIFNKVFENKTTIRKNRCPKHHFNDILLILAFSRASSYESIPLFDLLYKGGLINRVLCGPSLLPNGSDIIIDVVNTRNGAFLYECLSNAVDKYPNYTGYLFIAEEILLNYWNFLSYDKNKIWQDDGVINGPTLYSGTPDNWEWWASPWGMRAMEKAFEYLVERNYGDSRKSKLAEGDWKPEWDVNNALNAWLWNGHGEYKAFWINRTLLYLPKKYVPVYRKLAKIFRQSGVRHALALPTMIRMLDLGEEIEKLQGVQLDDVRSSNFSSNREFILEASTKKDFFFINGGTKQRHNVLNDLKLKEFAVGKFLYYDECPD